MAKDWVVGFYCYCLDEQDGRSFVCLKWALRIVVSKIQWKPFWLASQLYPQNDSTGWQCRLNFDMIRTGPRHWAFVWKSFASSCLAIKRHFVSCWLSTITRSCETRLCGVEVNTGLIRLMFKGSVEWSRHERHFCSLLPYFLLSWLQIFQLCLSFWTSSFDMVLFKKFLQEKEIYPKNLPKRLSS